MIPRPPAGTVAAKTSAAAAAEAEATYRAEMVSQTQTCSLRDIVAAGLSKKKGVKMSDFCL